MDASVETWLPDVTGMTLAELIDSDDPVLRDAADRLVDELRSRRDDDGGCGC